MLYEGGIRSPLVVWGPGLVAADKAGSVNRMSVFSAIDLVPTVLAVAGIEKPAGVEFDGQSLPDVLLGNSQASRSAPLFFRRPPDRGSFYGEADLPDLAVRDGNWKLLCEYDGSEPQLYDLTSDASEARDLSAENSAVVQRLTKSVVAWHNSMPPDNGATFGKKKKGR
jgi:uncharacterized sulfatase